MTTEAEKAAKKSAKESEINIEPIDFQCVLLSRTHQLQNPSSTYKSITKVKDEKLDPGYIMSRIQHGGRTNQVDEILNLCPDVYASLVPYLRLFRVEYDKNNDEIPGREKELTIPNFVSPSDVNDILGGKISGRIPGAGVKSFSWDLQGVQPAEVDNNITATLVVYFQSVNDFFAGAAASGSFQAGKDQPTFLDLIINSPGAPKTSSPSTSTPKTPCPNASKTRDYKGANFRIKATAGWSAPDNLEDIYPNLQKDYKTADGSSIGKTKGELLKEAIKATRVTLYLQQVRHDIAMNQDGSLTLTITYQAALNGILGSENFNILKPTEKTLPAEEFKDLKDLRGLLEAEQKKDSPNEDRIDDLLESINELEQKDRRLKYETLLAGLFKSSKIYQTYATIEELQIKDLSVLDEQERKAYFTTQTSNRGTPTKSAGSAKAPELPTDKSGEEAADAINKEQAKKFDDIQGEGLFDKQEDGAEIPFMFLGDFIDEILTQVANNNNKTNVKQMGLDMFLTNIEFLDIFTAFQLSDADLKAITKCKDSATLDQIQSNPYGKIYREINLADIPISLDLFQSWFVKNVIRKDREKYYFMPFIKDVVAELISNSLSSKCYGVNNKFKFYQRFDVQPLTYVEDGASPTTIGQIGLATNKLNDGTLKAGNKIRNALIMFSTDSRPKNLKGDRGEDMTKGIYHHYLGSACGLVKNINFQREDQPYLREAKIQRNGALGAEQLRELFSVSIDMVGNNLFKNGQYTYVNPTLINASKQMLNLLGLHGYYLVTGVKSEVTEKSFTTSLRALQEGIEFPELSGGGNASSKTDDSTNSSAPKNS